MTESLGSWELLFGIDRMRDWDGPDQEKRAVGQEYSFKESTVKQEKGNVPKYQRKGYERKDKTGSAKQERELGGKKKGEKKEKGTIWRSPNKMTIIQVPSKAWWNTKELLGQWSCKEIK